MPAATTTVTTEPPSVLPLKASQTASRPSSSSAVATLRSLYPRAARAFLQRDVALTNSLLSSAFSLIHPPHSSSTPKDALSSQRRKWDILRLTFETTLYATPPSQDPEALPSSLRANSMLTPESLIATLHARSVHLFTPLEPPQKPSSAYLPGQILVTLVLASLKLDCPEVGRGMIEDWLAKHGQELDADDPQAYAKVLELYCLHVLPRVQDWEYAEDFLTYERELPPDVRQHFLASLRQLRAEATAASRVQVALLPDPTSSSSSAASSRMPSPAPSDSDSSFSSTSTHTATPNSPRPHASANARRVHTLTPLTPSQTPTPKPRAAADRAPNHSASSSSIASTATSRTITPHTAERSKTRRTNGHAHPKAKSNSRSSSSTPSTGPGPGPSSSLVRRSSFGAPAAERSSSTGRPLSTLALLRASLGSVLQNTSKSRVVLYAVLFVVVPVVSFVFRLRRRRAGGALGSTSGAGGRTVDAVKRRLRGAEGQTSVVGQVWEELARAVMDTVRMAGRGLV